MKKLIALCTVLALCACANGPGGVLTTSQLSQAQAAAGSVLQVIKTDAALYVSQPGVTAQQATTINLAVGSLSAAVASFQSISSFGNVNQLATAVLITATAVVNALPNISVNDKIAIDAGISVLQVLLPVVFPATLATPPASGSIMLTPGNAFFNTIPAVGAAVPN